MNYKKAAEERKSIREFTDTPLTVSQRTAIGDYMLACRRLDTNIAIETRIVDGSAFNYFQGLAGYEGLSFHAPSYILLASEMKAGYAENAGYATEDMILHLTDMGLDCCWLTVEDGEAIRRAAQFPEDWMVMSVIACGNGKKERSLTRLHIKSPSDVTVVTREGHVAPKMSIQDMVYGGTWHEPADLDENFVDDGLRNAFYAASYAPTFLNRQPFRLMMDEGKVMLVKKMDALTGEFDARLNCGAVMLNFAAVLEERRPFTPLWVLGSPKKTYEVPADCEIVGYCEI